MSFEESAGKSYTDLIIAQLQEERERKTSIETRGVTVITTSGVLVGLLFGFGALVTKSDKFVLPNPSKPWLILALIAFMLAAAISILTNVPRGYREARADELRRLTDELFWGGPIEIGSMRVAQLYVRLLEAARAVTSQKAVLLSVALALEAIGVVLLAIVVWIVLTSPAAGIQKT